MKSPASYRYASSHEWAVASDGEVRVGITYHAQDQLGDIVHVELPMVGRKVKKGESVAEVESVKAVSEIYSPISGLISGVNAALAGSPELINKEPYTHGWLFAVAPDDVSELTGLMDAAAYDTHAGH